MKVIELSVDLDSAYSISQALVFLRSEQRLIKKKAFGVKDNVSSVPNSEIFEACFSILDKDISKLFPSCDESKREFYVYVHLNPLLPIYVNKKTPVLNFAASIGMNCTPFYVGKGTGGRAEMKDRNETHRKTLQKLKESGKEHDVFIVRKGLNESQALQLEAKLIDIFGLIVYGGFLCNLDESIARRERREMYRTALMKIHKSSWKEFIKE